MSKRKSLFALILTLALFLVTGLSGSVTTFADDETGTGGTCGDDLTWEFDEDTGTLTISGSGEMDDYSYSDSSPWYDLRTSITEVEIGSGITSIGEYAFYQCTGLTQITIPEGVVVIGASAFSRCTALTQVSLPDTLIGIDDAAFYYCAFSEITLPDGLRYIGGYAFAYCQNLNEVTIPASVIYIGDMSSAYGGENFYYCDTVYGYTNSAAYWYAEKFSGSYGDYEFSSIGALSDGDDGYIAGSAVTCGTKGDNLYWILYEDGQLFVCGIGDMEDTKVGNTSSSEWLWDYGEAIQKVTITEGVTSIGNYAFSGGSPSGNSDVQFDCLTEVVIGDDVTSIGKYAFYDCPVLETISIGAGVSSIGIWAFSYDTALQYISVSEENASFTAVDNILFSKDGTTIYRYPHDGSTEYEIPDGVTTVGMDAFGDVETLTSITVPVSVTAVYTSAFDGCSALTDVYYAGSESEWDAISISSDNDELTGAVIHYAVLEDLEVTDDEGETVTDISYTAGSGSDVVILSSGKVTYVESVTVDGETLDESCYTLDEDANSITFSSSYLETLSAGDYSITISYETGHYSSDSITVTLTVSASESGNGDSTDSGNGDSTDSGNGDSTDSGNGGSSDSENGGDSDTGTEKPSVASADITMASSFGYTGSAITPDVTVTIDGVVLEEGTDYTVSYSDNVEIGTASVTITGQGNYEGSITKTFLITVNITELYGSTRYGTMAAIAEETFESASYAVVATGTNFADALAAASLAGVLDAPVILVNEKQTNIDTALNELTQLGVTNVYITGGTAAVSESIADQIRALGIGVERLSGENRRETALAIAQKVQELSGDEMSKVCLVATGGNFADALSGSSYAYYSGSPIYLTKNDGEITEDVLSAIEEGGYETVIILGGTSAVSEESYEALCGIDGVSVERIAGNNRYLTSEQFAQWAAEHGLSYDNAVIATGDDYPDALAGSSLGGRNGSVMLLVNEKNSAVLEGILSENADDISNVYILGGTDAVSEKIRERISSALGI